MLVSFLLAAMIEWVALMPTVSNHVPRLEMRSGDDTGVCSSVVIEVDKDNYALALTAAHCVNKQPGEKLDVTANGRNAVVLATNDLLDLAIIRFKAKHDTPIVFAPSSPEQGAQVAIVGYAFGVEEMVAQFGYVAQTFNKETKALWINADLIFGDSGGPLLDQQGRLIGINSRIYSGGMLGQSAHIGAAVPIEMIQDFVDDFKQRQKDKQ